MSEQELSVPMSALARRLRNDPLYMAYALAAYQAQEKLTDEELGLELGLLPLLAIRLSLCKRPDPMSPDFADQVREIADFTLVDEEKLAHVLRQVDAVEKLAGRAASLSVPEEESRHLLAGLLTAARDRDEDKGASPEEQSKDEKEAEE
jgi:hypothetical protein